ncbi:MAG: NTP transferase domain-containing protein [Terriglobia bacterium]
MPPATSPENHPSSIAGLILAAGESSRMAPLGVHKALLEYRGRTFLETIVATLREAAVTRIIVVVGHRAERIQGQLASRLEGVEWVVNRDYPRGQTSSLQAGLTALDAGDAKAAVEAVILCLVDHPSVAAETVRAVVRAFRQSGTPVVLPTYQNQCGHPVLISRSLFAALVGLPQDAGANTVIRQHRDATQLVEVNDAGILVDVDDPESYLRLSVDR